jgi:YegS/Rv2252/BmrU family lipid kinase
MSEMLKTLAIINPISGTGKQNKIKELLLRHLDSERFQLEITETKFVGHAEQLAREATHNNYNAIIAIGGDGTINEISRALAFSDLILGIIPCGSGNGLARHLGIPMQTKKAILWINHAKILKMDTITANDHRFVNLAGIGFDALIAHRFAKMSSRGLSSYLKAVLTEFINFKSQTFHIISKQEDSVHTGMLLTFANSSQFGNDAYIAPNAKIDDGKMNLVLLKRPKWYQVPGLAIKVFTKRIHSSSLFSEIIGDEFIVKQEVNLGHVDGEPVVFGNEIHLKLAPKSLRVFSKNT